MSETSAWCAGPWKHSPIPNSTMAIAITPKAAPAVSQ